jgi:outer membrane protein OmpA-like peptidoglycan-associated protein
MLCATAAVAAPQARVSVDDYVKAIRSAPAPVAETPVAPPNGAAPAAANGCAAGSQPDEDGLCAPQVQTRGFSLARSGSVDNGAGYMGVRHVAHAAYAAPRRVVAPPRSSRLSDLLITFKLGSAELTDEGALTARNFALALSNAAIADVRFEIAGHTDASGSAERNMTLSQARADAVRAYLVGQGVSPERVEARGYGSTDLALPNDPKAAANRRVEARRLN